MESDELRIQQRGEINREIVRLFNQGWTDDELALRFDCSRNTIQRERCCKSQKRAFSEKAKPQIIDLYTNHKWDDQDIKNKTGAFRNSQDRFIRAAGFTLGEHSTKTFKRRFNTMLRLDFRTRYVDTLDTLYLVFFNFSKSDGGLKIKLGRTIYTLEHRFRNVSTAWQVVKK